MINITDKEIQDCETFFRMINTPIFPEGVFFSIERAKQIASMATYKGEIDRILQKPSGMIPCGYKPFFMDARCECGVVRKVKASKAEIQRFIKSFKDHPEGEVFLCETCFEAEKEAKKKQTNEWHAQYSEERKKERDKFAEFVTTQLLVPGFKTTSYLKFWHVKNQLENFFSPESLKEFICDIPYYDFLKTPYWKMCAYNVKKKAEFKCQICNSSENLSTHHRSYEYHGLEHTNEGQRSLTCVCQSCHNKHHFPSFEEYSKTNIYSQDEEIIAY